MLWYWLIDRNAKPAFDALMEDGSPWPKISVVTPSYNQGKFIEDTIRSVVMQGYPNLEYIIIDGGSTDNTVDIIKKYSNEITYWVSEKDNGQTQAINKGFEKSTGTILAYLNSDDVYQPYTFRTVAGLFSKFKEINWLTGYKTHLNDGHLVSPTWNETVAYDQKFYRKGLHLHNLLGWNQQPSTFWSRELFNRVGGKFNESINLNMDINLWIRFSEYERLYFVSTILGLMRKHPEQKSQRIQNTWELFEREQKYLNLYPLFFRKLIMTAYQIPGLRFLLKRMVYDPVGKIIVWDHDRGQWIMRTKNLF